MKIFIALAFSLAATCAQAAPFPNGNAQTGKALFDQYKCNSCHAAMLGGDGNAMFTRADRKVRSPADLIEQIKLCSGNVGAKLTPPEEQHLGAYLNRYYKLP